MQPARSARRDAPGIPRWLALGLVSLAALLLEVGYTRIVSYKLWYYYTYLVIGLALLGVGSGAVLVAVLRPFRRWETRSIVTWCSLGGAVTIALGYLVVARIGINTIAIWDYGTRASFGNLARLGVICFTLFATFIAFGIIVAVVLGRAGDRVGRLYFADLVGAGIGCLVAIPLISRLGPPRVVLLAALVFALVGLASALRPSAPFVAPAIAVLVLLAAVVPDDVLPDVRVEDRKEDGSGAAFSEWGPVFRVDVIPVGDRALLLHDATYGSGIWEFDGDTEALTRFDSDPRSIPFRVLGEPPERELIIGSAGGNEILASLHFEAPLVEAVELNPVTVSLLTDHFADFTGRLAERPDVALTQGDGRTYLARSEARYDLVWFVAPDSYAATNAASSGAFVLSESYLYTKDMIAETLEHLDDDGIMVVQFGELDAERRPNRTARYLVTARAALEQLGVENPGDHLLVALELTEDRGDLSTIVVKRTPFTQDEADRFADTLPALPQHVGVHAPGHDFGDGLLAGLAGGTDAQVAELVDSYPKDISAITDDAPFFWHFTPFRDVVADILEPIEVLDPEDAVGERVLLLLLTFAAVYAAVFLLAPFVFVRKQWRALPRKGTSAIYFFALGIGFMLYEITMIQRLVRFLGYPTYSLTVTLAAILVTTGIGSLLSPRLAGRRGAMPFLIAVLAVLTAFYRFGLDDLTDALQDRGLGVRVFVAVLVLAPLGLVLGMFMPLGLGAVRALGPDGEQYVAWSWAVNGFASVMGSVLTTILSMAFGFRLVQLGAFAVYVVAGLAFTRLVAGAPSTVAGDLVIQTDEVTAPEVPAVSS
ncbi:MAG: hypothetical protein KatS3mg010_1880 [Acidimicrobiia bacterium]|nr:MAG: hypothetical protein KatS3mg010_1880 [Acidimicrobiia bacterium]